MSDSAVFLFEATRCLCSSLLFEESLNSFFHYIREVLPVREFRLSTTSPPYTHVERVALVNAQEVIVKPLRAPILPEQKVLGAKLDMHDLAKMSEYLVTSQDDDFYCYLSLFPDFSLPLPCFYVRLVRNNRILGSAMFIGEADFQEEHLALMRGLEAPLCTALNNMLQYRELAELKEQLYQDNQRLRRTLHAYKDMEIIGMRGGLGGVVKRLEMAAPVDVPVLITGETGTGKEILARLVHSLSPRREMPFVVVNCGAIPSTLVDSELFGHVRGAFTGASSNHMGKFERAQNGTLFLDEIGELPLEVQARLLRVLETGEIERVGGNGPVKVNIRLLAATHRDLPGMVRQGNFREDLYYRLRVVHIHVPPLRERRQDIPELTQQLLQRSAAKYGISCFLPAPGEMEKLLHYAWPGNVRELQNVLEEALVCANGTSLTITLGTGEGAGPQEVGTMPSLDTLLRRYYTDCLAHSRNRIEGQGGAAQLAGLAPSTFRFRCKKLGVIRPPSR